jgi:hypothetical protein
MSENVVRPEYYGAVGDDSSYNDGPALQAAINASWTLHVPVALYAKTYYTHQELLIPYAKHSVLLGTPYVDNKKTTIKAGAAIRSCLTIWSTCVIKNIGFDGARLSTYCMYWQGCSLSYFENVGVVSALRDGVFLTNNDDNGNHAINATNTLIDFATARNGTLFYHPDILQELEPFKQRIDLPQTSLSPLQGATCELTKDSGDIVFSGVDLTTLNLRKGDPIRVGTGVNKQFGIVASVHNASHLTAYLAPYGTASVTAAGQIFAIGSGDGWHEMRSGDNNIAVMLSGFHQSNAGFALAFDGMYGPTLTGQQIEYHPFWAIRVGSQGGDPVISSSFTKLYFEALGANKPFCCVSAQAMTVISPIDNDGTPDHNIDYPAGPGTNIGIYINKEGIQPIGTPGGVKNTVASAYLLNAISDEGFAFFKRELAPAGGPGYVLSVTGTTTLSGNYAILEPAGLDRVLTGTPTIEPANAAGRLVYLQCKGPNAITFQNDSLLPGGLNGSKLKLRSQKVTLSQFEGILLFSDGSYWHEVGRTRDVTSNVEIDGPPVLRAVDAGTIAAGTTIPVASGLVIVNPSSAITMTATPTFTNGLADGQELIVINKHTVNTLTLQDESGLTGSNLRLMAASVKLGAYSTIRLLWLDEKWNQIGDQPRYRRKSRYRRK